MEKKAKEKHEFKGRLARIARVSGIEAAEKILAERSRSDVSRKDSKVIANAPLEQPAPKSAWRKKKNGK